MKTFLTICTCAMIAAGLYGFIDMAGDVANGTMIRYYHGDEEAVDLSAAAVGVTLIDKAQLLKQAKTSSEYKIVVPKNEPAPEEIANEPKQNVKESSTETIAEKEEPVLKEKFNSDVVPDSMPAAVVEEGIDYSDFSRGEIRPRKNKKRSKK